MNDDDDDDNDVDNTYSICAADRHNVPGSKRECLDHIQQVWSELQSLSLRKHMEQLASQRLARSAAHE